MNDAKRGSACVLHVSQFKGPSIARVLRKDELRNGGRMTSHAVVGRPLTGDDGTKGHRLLGRQILDKIHQSSNAFKVANGSLLFSFKQLKTMLIHMKRPPAHATVCQMHISLSDSIENAE